MPYSVYQESLWGLDFYFVLPMNMEDIPIFVDVKHLVSLNASLLLEVASYLCSLRLLNMTPGSEMQNVFEWKFFAALSCINFVFA